MDAVKREDISSFRFDNPRLTEKKRKKRVVGAFTAFAIINIFFPIAGLILPFLFLFKNKIKRVQNAELLGNNYLHVADALPDEIDIEKESDIIALEDSLYMSSILDRRRTMINVLKDESDGYYKFINRALTNNDPETVHYAATSVLDKKMKLEAEFKEVFKNFAGNPMNIDYAVEYVDQLKKRLTLPFLAQAIRSQHTTEIVRTLRLITDNRLSSDEKYIADLIKYLIVSCSDKELEQYMNTYDRDYPDTEEKFMTLIKGYYVLNNDTEFKKILYRAQGSDIILSKEAVETVKFWIE